MSDFQERTVTTKETKHCVVCYGEHKTGAKVLMKFTRTEIGTATVVFCDEICLLTLRESDRSLENFLTRQSLQFN